MKKYSWLIIGLLAFSMSPAALAINFVFPVDPQDQSLKFLGMLFGAMNQMPLEGNDALLPAIFKIFSYIALSLTLVIVVYSLFTAALNTAHEGKVLGSKFSVIFTPIRSVLGVALLMPSSSGYAWIQIVFMWVVLNGVGAANGVWNTVIDAYDAGISISNPNLSAPKNDTGFQIAKEIYALALMTQYVTHVNTLPPVPEAKFPTTPEDLENLKKFVPGITAKFVIPTKNITYLSVDGTDGEPARILFRNVADDMSAPPEKIYGTIYAMDFTKAIKTAATAGSTLSAVLSSNPLGGDVASAVASTPDMSDEKVAEINRKLQKIQIAEIMTLLDEMSSNAMASMDLISSHVNKPVVMKQLFNKLTGSDSIDPDLIDFLAALEPNSTLTYSLLQAHGLKINQLVNPLYAPYKDVYATEIPGYGAAPPSVSEEARTVGWALAGVYYYKLASPPPPPVFSKDYEIKVLSVNPDAPTTYFLPKEIETAIGCGTVQASHCQDTLNSLRSFSTMLVSSEQPGLKTPNTPPAVPKSSSAFQTLTDSGDFDGDTAKSLGAIRGFSDDFSKLYKSLVEDVSNFVNSPQEDPLMSLAILGGQIMGGIETFFFGFLAAIVVFGLTGGGACLSPVFVVVLVAIILLMPIIIVFITLLWGLAGMMAIYYPLVPYIIYLFAVFGWLLIVFEGVVAAPIIAIALTVPSEDDVGKLGATVTQWIAVFIRPALTVMGFILAARLFIACIQFFSGTFLSTLTAQLPGSSLFAAIPILAMFVSTVGILIQRCFSATYLIPDQVIRWIGGTPDDTSAGEALSAAKSATEKTQQATGQVMSQTGKAIASSAKEGAASAAKGGA